MTSSKEPGFERTFYVVQVHRWPVEILKVKGLVIGDSFHYPTGYMLNDGEEYITERPLANCYDTFEGARVRFEELRQVFRADLEKQLKELNELQGPTVIEIPETKDHGL